MFIADELADVTDAAIKKQQQDRLIKAEGLYKNIIIECRRLANTGRSEIELNNCSEFFKHLNAADSFDWLLTKIKSDSFNVDFIDRATWRIRFNWKRKEEKDVTS